MRIISLLEAEANAHPQDAVRQYNYLQRLSSIKPEEVVRRYESNIFANDERCAAEYINVMSRLNRLDQVKPTAFKTLNYGSTKSSNSMFGLNLLRPKKGGGAEKIAGSEAEPIYVQLSQPTFRTLIMKVFRYSIGVFLFFSFLGTFVDDKNLAKSLGIPNVSQTVMPSEDSTTTFEDVKGAKEAKHELEEIVEYLRHPEEFTKLGGQLPRGVLLMGPPGTGKTLLARAIAGEAGVPFYYASGSDFEEMYVGVGARRVRDLFAAAKKNSPCIIFIDEIDAIGGKRNNGVMQSLRMTLNQLLVELDGFKKSEGVIVIAATNFASSLDKALTRPGRFDVHVSVPLPDVQDRTEIIEHYLVKLPSVEADIDPKVLARGTPGCSGADLFNMVNSAAIKASMDKDKKVTMKHLEWAKDKILMGPERKSAVIPMEERKNTAYHEGGHALVAMFTPGAMPIHKATIMPRGQALGYVSQLPEGDVLTMTRQQCNARIDVCMGGRVAEELIFGADQITSGASSDLMQATNIARSMVTEYGMSPVVGPVHYNSLETAEVSPEARGIIDHEVRKILEDSRLRVVKLLTSRKADLHKVANALMEYETLDRIQLRDAVNGKLKM